jgi:GAF domain-containing protein
VLAHSGDDAAARPPDTDERAAADRAAAEGSVQGFGSTGLDRHRARRIHVPTGRSAAFTRERAVALVPLTLGDRVLGVLRLDGPIGNSPFRDDPARLLNAVAAEAALAVQRAELTASTA